MQMQNETHFSSFQVKYLHLLTIKFITVNHLKEVTMTQKNLTFPFHKQLEKVTLSVSYIYNIYI